MGMLPGLGGNASPPAASTQSSGAPAPRKRGSIIGALLPSSNAPEKKLTAAEKKKEKKQEAFQQAVDGNQDFQKKAMLVGMMAKPIVRKCFRAWGNHVKRQVASRAEQQRINAMIAASAAKKKAAGSRTRALLVF